MKITKKELINKLHHEFGRGLIVGIILGIFMGLYVGGIL